VPHWTQTQAPRTDATGVGLLRVVVLALLATATGACDGAPPARSERAPRVDDEPSAEDLAALGYVDYAEEDDAGDGAPDGLVHFDARASDGYTLLVSIPEARAFLLDTAGETRHEWRDPDCRQWTRAELGPDGDLLVIGRLALDDDAEPDAESASTDDGSDESASDSGRFLARYRWDGALVWRRALRVHHDVEWTDAGKILAIADEPRRVDGLYIQDDQLLVLDPDGQVERTLSIYDLLTSRPDIYRLPRQTDRKHATLPDGRVDLFHTNSCASMPFAELRGSTPLHRRAAVLLSVRHQDLVAVVDLASEQLVWAFGPGQVRYQHEASWLANGNLLVFDNGTKGRGWSRVLELDPLRLDVVWEYKATPPEAFFSNGRGTAQRLDSGNTQIASSNQGEVFEVTRSGDVVWRYVHRSGGKRVVLRASHYPRSVVDPLLGGS
jgi:hypothetical protein